MKKLLVSLVVLATIFSCGKKNTVSGNSVSGLSSSVSGATETSLASQINNNQFGTGYATYGLTWAQLISNQPNLTYYYASSGLSTVSCETKWTIFKICSTSSSSSSSNITRQVTNSSVDLNSKKSELINIINARTSIQNSGTVYYIITNNAKQYIIDTAKPLQANPVQVQDNATSKVEYFSYAL